MNNIPSNSDEAIKFLIEYYANNALSRDILLLQNIYSKLNKKKFKDLNEIHAIYDLFNAKPDNINYLKKIGEVDFTNIELLLNDYSYVDLSDSDPVVEMIKYNLDQENITYDASRILYCMYRELCKLNKKHVLQIIVFLIHQKMNNKSIVFNEVPVSNKNDIEWFLWKIIFIKSAEMTETIHNFVLINMKIYSLNWTKKHKLGRANILLHVYALLSSKNVGKYLPEQKLLNSDKLNYLHCYIPVNETLKNEVIQERIKFTKEHTEKTKDSQTRMCPFSTNYTSQQDSYPYH